MPRLPFLPSLLAALAIVSQTWGAESELVGVLAVALEPAVARELGLNAEQLGQLQAIADEREMKGMARAIKLAKLPRDERVARLAEFRAESERLALALLTAEQGAKLREVAAGRDDAALAPGTKVTTQNTEKTETKVVEEAAEPALEGAREGAAPPTSVDAATGEAPAVPTPPGDGPLSFNFTRQPWGEVIRWFADRAGLSLVVDQVPPGSLTYRDDRAYTPAEALDVLNGVLLTKGFTLVRKDRMLLVIDLEQDAIPPNAVTDVPVEELARRGEYELVRVLVDLGEVDATAAADSLTRLVGPQGAVVVLPEARMLQVTETAGRIRTMLRVIEGMRRAASPSAAEGAELRSYPLGGADAATTLTILQSLLEGSATARLAVDDQTRSLIALATAAEHVAIGETLERLQTDGRRVEVIPVRAVDPLTAAALVNKLFNPGKGEDKKPDPNAPVVEPDRGGGALLVRGAADQVRQIRELVERLDAPVASAPPGERGPVRNLPVTGAELEQVLEQLRTVWPTLRSNPLRLTSPVEGLPSFRPGAEVERELREGEDPLDRLDDLSPAEEEAPRGASAGQRSPFRFVNEGVGEDEGAEIVIAPGVGSTVIASSDVEALDLFEELLATLLGDTAGGGREYAVFYLKFADAPTAAALLGSLFGGESGGGSLVGDLAGAAIGGQGGDLVGDLLGMGGGSDGVGFSSVSVDVVPDVRLNALYVYAAPDDLELVHRLLRVIDQPRGPDRVESIGVPRLIRLENSDVDDVAAVVRQVFEDRIGAGGGGAGQPSPQEFLRALQGGEKGADDQEPERMTVGVDQRSNSLVVRSSEPLFEEVRTLVEQLDRAGVERPVATRVVSLRNTGSEALRETLLSLLGDKAAPAGQGGAASTGGSNPTPGQPAAAPGADADRARRELQERVERFRDVQRMFERMREQRGGEGRGERRPGRPAASGR